MALARSLMTPSDVVLLDDVLSAVDVHVATALVQDALLGALKESTRGADLSPVTCNIHRWEVISPRKMGFGSLHFGLSYGWYFTSYLSRYIHVRIV